MPKRVLKPQIVLEIANSLIIIRSFKKFIHNTASNVMVWYPWNNYRSKKVANQD